MCQIPFYTYICRYNLNLSRSNPHSNYFFEISHSQIYQLSDEIGVVHVLYFQACVQNSSYALVLWFLNFCFEFPFNFGFGIFCLCAVVAAVAWCQIPAFINACCATVQESKAAEYRFSYRKYTQRKNTNTK